MILQYIRGKQGVFDQCPAAIKRQRIDEAHFPILGGSEIEKSGQVWIEDIRFALDFPTAEMLL